MDYLLKLIQAVSGSAAFIVAIVSVIVALLVYLGRGRFKFGQLSIDFGAASIQVKPQASKVSRDLLQSSPADKQFLLLKEYHSQGLAQSKISFWFSLIFASLGFAVIVGSIMTMDKNARFTEQGRTLVSLISGTVIEAVSALFFVQSNKARELMIEFFDKLRADRKLEESLRLAEQLPDPLLQSRLKIILALNFVDRKSNDEFLCSVLDVRQLPSTQPQVPGDSNAKGV